MFRRLALPALALAAVITPLAAQSKQPPDWKVRADKAGADLTKLEFVSMAPGWHVTTGPSVSLWNPATTAKGSFSVTSKIWLFKPSGAHAEGFGLLVGGSDLDGPAQRYTYFLVRNDGKYLIKERNGTETKDIVPWTASPAIKTHDGKVDNIDNTLSVTATDKSVDFAINGTQVASKPRASMPVDGIVGLRVNHNLNIHVQTLEVK
jgi:hypothetical protein